MDERTKAMFADAERSAERVIGQLRMVMALSYVLAQSRDRVAKSLLRRRPGSGRSVGAS